MSGTGIGCDNCSYDGETYSYCSRCIRNIEIRAARIATEEERERCLKGYESLKDMFIREQEFEYAKKVEQWIKEIRG